MKSLKIRDITLGEGTPKICVPIVAETKEEIIEQAKKISTSKADLVELRVDWIEDLSEENVLTILEDIREILNDKPILYTIRTFQEGGHKEIDTIDYLRLNKLAIKSKKIDLVDVEVFLGDEIVNEIVNIAHENLVKVIGSNHDFDATPNKGEIIKRLNKMQDVDVDIPKIAVMPNSANDVLILLDGTNEFYNNYADRPIITMSMGEVGMISRISGKTFGSSLTFASLGKSSAPGQINIDELYNMLSII